MQRPALLSKPAALPNATGSQVTDSDFSDAYLSPPESSSSSSAAPSFSSFRSTPTASLSHSGDSSRSQIELMSSGQDMDFGSEVRASTSKEGPKKPVFSLPSIASSIAGLPSEFTSRVMIPHNFPPPASSQQSYIPFVNFLPPPSPKSASFPQSPISLVPYSLSYDLRSSEDDRDHRDHSQAGANPEPGPSTEYSARKYGG